MCNGFGCIQTHELHGRAKKQTFRMISFLKACILLLEDDDTSPEFVKMYDIVHEAAILVAYRFGEDEGITQKVNEIIQSGPLHVIGHPVGLTSCVKEVISLLDLQSSYDVNIVGIYGIRGVGKSTIARVVYNLIANVFGDSCFFADAGENASTHGLVHLQEALLSDILGKNDIKVRHVNRGISIIQTWVRTRKVLLILDNIDKLKQLQSVAGGLDWFGPRSRIIVATRDKDLLLVHGVEKIYDVEKFNHEEALELFTWIAFKVEKMDPSYMDISNHVILNSNGLPLALEMVCSKLFGKNVEEWKHYLRILEERLRKYLKQATTGGMKMRKKF